MLCFQSYPISVQKPFGAMSASVLLRSGKVGSWNACTNRLRSVASRTGYLSKLWRHLPIFDLIWYKLHNLWIKHELFASRRLYFPPNSILKSWTALNMAANMTQIVVFSIWQNQLCLRLKIPNQVNELIQKNETKPFFWLAHWSKPEKAKWDFMLIRWVQIL